MSVDIRDKHVLEAVSPAALAAYARSAGWQKIGKFGDHSDVYSNYSKPEVIIPRTERLGDYSRTVSQLIEIYSKVSGKDEISLYRTLVTADRDVVRFQGSPRGDDWRLDDGNLPIDYVIQMLSGARDLLLSIACSLHGPQTLDCLRAIGAEDYLLQGASLSQVDHNCSTIDVLMPVSNSGSSWPFSNVDHENFPYERELTLRLVEALAAIHDAIEKTNAGDGKAFNNAVDYGVSAILCESLVKLIGPFASLDISVSWALTLPGSVPDDNFQFSEFDASALRKASRVLRKHAPKTNVQLYGFVEIPIRSEEDDGTIHLITTIEGYKKSVTANLAQFDYERAVIAHQSKAMVVLEGDLKQTGQRWRLLNPRIKDIVNSDESTLDEQFH